MHLPDAAVLLTAVVSAAYALPTPAKGTFSVCTGSVCTKHGADLVLESAQALACTGGIAVRAAGCLNACKSREHTAVAIYAGKKGVIAACPDDAPLALDLCHAELQEAGASCASMHAGLARKAVGDAALAAGEFAAAVAAYTEAIDAAPDGFCAAETAAAGAAAPKAAGPAKLTGLPPSRRAVVIKKERERTTPGRVRWLYAALLGRCRARLAIATAVDDAVADAQAAVGLCPLDADGWAALAMAAEASGNGDGAAEAAAEAARRRPQGGTIPAWLSAALPAPASAASVTYDFGYRLERALDEDKRGPAEDAGGGAEALMNMCAPPTAETAAAQPAAAEITATAEEASGVAAISTIKPAGTVGVAAGAVAAAAAPPDPASSSSIEPLLAVCGDMIDGVLCHLSPVL